MFSLLQKTIYRMNEIMEPVFQYPVPVDITSEPRRFILQKFKEFPASDLLQNSVAIV